MTRMRLAASTGRQSIAVPASKALSVPVTYSELRKAVQVAMVQGQQAVERAKVRTYHETGRLISEHLLQNRDRAEYGAATIQRLTGDLKVDRSVLQRCVQFARAFPNCAPWRNLTWGHFRTLIPVEDAVQRRALARQADRELWTVVQLEQRVRAIMPVVPDDASVLDSGAKPRPLTPKRGTPGVCRVVAAGEGMAVDLGFACFRELADESEGKARASSLACAAGDFVQMDAGRITAARDATKADLFTYRVTILKVVDGDTLWVKVHLTPDLWVKQKLRLRDLDAPEIATAEGRAAKRFVETVLAEAVGVTVCTTKPDKYDRYLADVFIGVASEEGRVTSDEEVFLNNALLAAGHAVLKKEWEFSDWGD